MVEVAAIDGLYERGPVLGGGVFYPASSALDVLRFFREFSETIPDELKPWSWENLDRIVGVTSRLHSESPVKIAEGANRRRKVVRTPGYSNYRKSDGACCRAGVEALAMSLLNIHFAEAEAV